MMTFQPYVLRTGFSSYIHITIVSCAQYRVSPEAGILSRDCNERPLRVVDGGAISPPIDGDTSTLDDRRTWTWAPKRNSISS